MNWKVFSLVAGAVAIGSGLVIPAIGFTEIGVAAGSIAAVIHSGIGKVVAGKAFDALQIRVYSAEASLE